jgi:hypothetical protein
MYFHLSATASRSTTRALLLFPRGTYLYLFGSNVGLLSAGGSCLKLRLQLCLQLLLNLLLQSSSLGLLGRRGSG